MLNELDTQSDGNKLWSEARGGYNSDIRMVYMAEQNSQLDNACDIVLDGIAGLLLSTAVTCKGAGMLNGVTWMKENMLFKLVQSSITNEKKLIADEENYHRNSVFKCNLKKVDR